MVERERQNLMLSATVCVAAGDQYRVRVRDISRGGLKVTGPLYPKAGQCVRIELPNLGWLRGKVAWSDDYNFGIELRSEIDPSKVRNQVGGSYARLAEPDLRRVA